MAAPNFHTFVDYPENFPMPGIVVPQQVYPSQQPFQRLPSIRFSENGRPGIRLANVLNDNPAGMPDAITPAPLPQDTARVTIRILWPGYEQWSRPLNTTTGGAHNFAITKGRLVLELARYIRECLTHLSSRRSTERRPDWWVNNVPFDNLVLLELRHASAGSWQPVLCRQ